MNNTGNTMGGSALAQAGALAGSMGNRGIGNTPTATGDVSSAILKIGQFLGQIGHPLAGFFTPQGHQLLMQKMGQQNVPSYSAMTGMAGGNFSQPHQGFQSTLNQGPVGGYSIGSQPK